jgi:hypothetical protein
MNCFFKPTEKHQCHVKYNKSNYFFCHVRRKKVKKSFPILSFFHFRSAPSAASGQDGHHHQDSCQQEETALRRRWIQSGPLLH